ncbi:MAG: hypothetical protein COS30_01865 [Candidatus Portnoybacteria bacterium CG02_land_8_20_14_3_00_45_8]|uniref:Uncharacterized protein n=1 Tax=Candidatus Portnoybacteria bacterium CG02_land_8_20_14_3_00_45_8 TaxID=1974807 RepID=A0A2M7D650_9BACT|nr:MAG: hypothetical protein COS30_01865 [Candidatus Portnoybacteria bacterium CG02_land_8_20_14_3_00_45_8]
MIENKLNLNWSAVEKALAEGTFSGYKIGVLETEKIFADLLKSKQIPGSTIERQIKYIEKYLSLRDKLDYSRHIYERIINEPHFALAREETKQIISGYWQAMLDIEEAVQSLSRWEKITLRLKYIWNLTAKNLRNVLLAVLAASALIWLLSETSAGKKTALFIVSANHFFIFKVLLWTLIVIASLLALGGILYFTTRSKKKF